MAVPSEPTSTICTKCNKNIPAPNINLHVAHCTRNLERCKFCGEMVPKSQIERHYSKTHKPVACKQCGETIDSDNSAKHLYEDCPMRIVTCEYCYYRLPAVKLFEHQDICPNQIQNCHSCRCRDISSTRREKRAPRRGAARTWQPKQLLFTVVVTGAAIFLSSIFFQKKDDHGKYL